MDKITDTIIEKIKAKGKVLQAKQKMSFVAQRLSERENSSSTEFKTISQIIVTEIAILQCVLPITTMRVCGCSGFFTSVYYFTIRRTEIAT